MSTGVQQWADEAHELLADLRVGLRVLVLGPGEKSEKKWFEKRKEIIKAIEEASRGNDTVCTCEDLFRLQPDPPVEIGYAELTHVERADIVVALIVASPSEQGGVYRELDIIAGFPKFRKKVIIFLPTQKSYLERFQAGALKVYKEEQKVSMKWPTLLQCKELRKTCVSKIDAERRVRMFDAFVAKMHALGKEI